MTRSTRHDLLRRTWWRATGIRAVRTLAQTAVALIGSAVLVTEVSWLTVASGSVLAGVLAVLTAVASTPPEAELHTGGVIRLEDAPRFGDG